MLLLAPVVLAGGSWDDFTNNLATDLVRRMTLQFTILDIADDFDFARHP